MIKNRKKLLIGILLIVSIILYIGINYVVCMQDEEDYNIKNNTDDSKTENILNIKSNFDYAYDISNNNTLSEHSEYIVLLKINSIDGVNNVNRKTGEPVAHPYSYGKATILKKIKGEIESTDIEFIRTGGEMPYSEWIKGDVDSSKLEAIRTESGLANVPVNDIKVKYKADGDIELEAGKIYLAFMNHNLKYNNNNEYNIQGFQYGLREILVRNDINTNAVEKLKVKNNDTGKWENLSDVVSFGEVK